VAQDDAAAAAWFAAAAQAGHSHAAHKHGHATREVARASALVARREGTGAALGGFQVAPGGGSSGGTAVFSSGPAAHVHLGDGRPGREGGNPDVAVDGHGADDARTWSPGSLVLWLAIKVDVRPRCKRHGALVSLGGAFGSDDRVFGTPEYVKKKQHMAAAAVARGKAAARAKAAGEGGRADDDAYGGGGAEGAAGSDPGSLSWSSAVAPGSAAPRPPWHQRHAEHFHPEPGEVEPQVRASSFLVLAPFAFVFAPAFACVARSRRWLASRCARFVDLQRTQESRPQFTALDLVPQGRGGRGVVRQLAVVLTCIFPCSCG
jgi:hypothetical protein